MYIFSFVMNIRCEFTISSMYNLNAIELRIVTVVMSVNDDSL